MAVAGATEVVNKAKNELLSKILAFGKRHAFGQIPGGNMALFAGAGATMGAGLSLFDRNRSIASGAIQGGVQGATLYGARGAFRAGRARIGAAAGAAKSTAAGATKRGFAGAARGRAGYAGQFSGQQYSEWGI